MLAKNVTVSDLEQALALVTEQYDNNVIWNRSPEPAIGRRNWFRFTLKVENSKGPGAMFRETRYTKSGIRRTCSACWHVHGHFFEHLFKINPDAIVKSGGRTITKNEGNWQERNIGSHYYPQYHSHACEC